MLRTTIARPMVAARLAQTGALRYSSSSPSSTDYSRLFVAAEDQAKAYKDEYDHTTAHAVHTASLWKRIAIIVCVPALIGTGISTYYLEKKHHEHAAAHPRPSDDELPPEYEFQNIRATKYFWGNGDQTLFWNPKVNHHKKE